MSYLKDVLYRKPDTAGEVLSIQNFKDSKVRRMFDDGVKKLAAVGVNLTKTGAKRGGMDEFKVNVVGGHESTAYYGEDLEDIILTGLGLSAWPADHASPNLSSTIEGIIRKASE